MKVGNDVMRDDLSAVLDYIKEKHPEANTATLLAAAYAAGATRAERILQEQASKAN